MPVGNRASPRSPNDMTAQVASIAKTSPRVAAELEDLCMSAMDTMRAMMEHGSTDERIAVFKALSPIIAKMNQGDDVDDGLDAAARARDLLHGHWENLTS